MVNIHEMTIMGVVSLLLFFFSSRRRHTRCYRDWSSDVCSSDLVRDRLCQIIRQHNLDPTLVKAYAVDFCKTKALREEIGRASCRERVESSVLAGTLKKKTVM